MLSSTTVFSLSERRLHRARLAEKRLASAIAALDSVWAAANRGGPIQTIQEIAADALAELRDPATGKLWGLE